MKISANKGGNGCFRIVLTPNEMEYLSDDKNISHLMIGYDRETKLFTVRPSVGVEPFASKILRDDNSFVVQKSFAAFPTENFPLFASVDPNAKTGSLEVGKHRVKTFCFVLPENLPPHRVRQVREVRDVTPPKGKTDRLKALLDALNKEAKAQGAELFIRNGDVCARVLTMQEL